MECPSKNDCRKVVIFLEKSKSIERQDGMNRMFAAGSLARQPYAEPCKNRAKQHRLCANSIDVPLYFCTWLVAMPFHLLNCKITFFVIPIRFALYHHLRVFAHLFDAVLSLPAKFLLCQKHRNSRWRYRLHGRV